MSHEQPVGDLLAAFSAVMRSRGARWYLFGAQAVIVWGRPRATADVDVTAQVRPSEAPELVSEMEAGGFQVRVPDPREFVARTRVLPFVHRASGLPLDVVLAGPGLEEDFLERAVEVEIGDLRVPVISPEDLIVAKLLAGRGRDLDDVAGILRERGGSLDLGRVRDTLSLIESALSRSDLTPQLERQLDRARPDSGA